MIFDKNANIIEIRNYDEEIVRITSAGKTIVNPRFDTHSAAIKFWAAVGFYGKWGNRLFKLLKVFKCLSRGANLRVRVTNLFDAK